MTMRYERATDTYRFYSPHGWLLAEVSGELVRWMQARELAVDRSRSTPETNPDDA